MLAQPSLPKGARITFQSAFNLFGLGYSEDFPLPNKIDLGAPVQVTGTAGTIISVELAYPIDVVFFEGQKSAAMRATLVPLVRALGYAPRINNNATNAAGPYNILYAGTDVPVFAIKDVFKVASQAHLDFRYIQPQVRLSSGIQNQIQIGDNSKASCLPSISAGTLTSLTESTSDGDFLSLAAKLPKPGSC